MTPPRSCEVKSYTRRLPGKTVVYAEKHVELFVEVRTRDLPDELEAALAEAMEAPGFELHGGLV